MTKPKIETMKPLSAGILAGVALWLSAAIAPAQVALTDIGATPPTLGPNDISQLNFNSGQPGGLNYYWDNGANNGLWMGQSFTTGNYPNGYVLTNLVIGTSGNGGGGQFSSQSYSLYIYQLSGAGLTTATPVANFTATGQLNADSDWLQWSGLTLQLQPNTTYAYGFGRDASASGYERLASTNNWPYQGGQACAIPTSGGTVTYANPTNTYDAAFDVGLALVGIPLVSAPTYTNSAPIYSGTPVTLTEVAAGEAPLTYQWLTDGGSGGALTNIPGATMASLSLNTTAFSGNYNYQVKVANAEGTVTSAAVTLSVSTSQALLVTDIGPITQTYAFVGQPMQFSATFSGSLPISYQWLDESLTATNPVGQDTNVLTIPSVQTTDAGTYQLMASNVYSAANGGPVFTSTTALGVLPTPSAPTPASDPYGALVLSYAPLAFWELNETNVNPGSGISPAYDFTGHGFFGLYGTDATTGYNGVQGPQPPTYPGFPTNQTAMATATADTNGDCSVPSLKLNTNAVSITMWINPNDVVPTYAGLFFYRAANDVDAAGLGFGGSQNAAGMAALGFTWNTNSGSTYNWNSGLFPVIGTWQYVALVIQPTNATIYLYYLDPVTQQPHLSFSMNSMAYTPEAFDTIVQSGAGIWIGNNRGGNTPYPGPVFNGSICDVAVFNYSLSQSQVLALFSEGVGISKYAPQISTQPLSTEAYPGATVTFTAGGISGTPPLSYQWQFNSANLPGATNVSLIISNVTALANNGSYQLVITNVVGVTVSSNATLTVVPFPPQNLLGQWFAGAASTADVSGYSPAGTHDAFDINSDGGGSYFFTNDVPTNETGVSVYLANDGFLITNSSTADNSYVDTYDDTITNSFTVMCWAKGYPGGWNAWVSKYGENGLGWQLRVDNSDHPCFTVRGTGGTEDMAAPNTSNDGNWHHYAGTYDQVTGNRDLYVDGKLVVSESGQGPYALSPTTHLSIGAKDQPSGNNFTGFYTGQIYDVRVYSDALPQTNIEAIVAGSSTTLTLGSQFNRSADQIVLTWTTGTLLQATNLLGPWVPVANATSPHTNSVTATGQMFFRLSSQ